MPSSTKIPIQVSKEAVGVQGAGGMMDVNTYDPIAQAAGALGNRVKEWGLAEAKAEELMNVANARLVMQERFDLLSSTLATQKPSKAALGFQMEASKIQADASALIKSKFGRRQFAADFAELKARYGVSVRKATRKRFIDKGIADLDQKIENQYQLMSGINLQQPGGMDKYAGHVNTVRRFIANHKLAGHIDAENAGKRERQLLSRSDEIQAQALIRSDPVKAEDALFDTAQFKRLDPLVRSRLQTLASNKVATAQKARIAAEEKDERDRERNAKVARSETAAGIQSGILSGNGYSLADLSDEKHDIGGDEALNPKERMQLQRLIATLQKEGETIETDPEVYTTYANLAYTIGDLPEAKKEARRASLRISIRGSVTAKKLKASDAVRIMGIIDGQMKEGAQFAKAKIERDSLKYALGGADVEFQMPGTKTKEELGIRSRRAAALREYDQRVHHAMEDPTKVRIDILKRATTLTVATIDSAFNSIIKPPYADAGNPVNWTEDNIQQSRIALAAAVVQKLIKPSMLNTYSQTLDQLSSLIRQRDRVRAAEKSTGGDGNKDVNARTKKTLGSK